MMPFDVINIVYECEKKFLENRDNLSERVDDLISKFLKIAADYIKEYFVLKTEKKYAIMASVYIIHRKQWLVVTEPIIIGRNNSKIVKKFKKICTELRKKNLTINTIFENVCSNKEKWFSIEFIFLEKDRFQLKKISYPFQKSSILPEDIDTQTLNHYKELIDLDEFISKTGEFVRAFADEKLPAYQYDIPVLLGELFFGHLVVDTNFEIRSPFEFMFLKMMAEKIFSYCAERLSSQINKTMKKHALRSAVAAIMARNMSHTLGSQILMRCKTLNSLDELRQELENSFSQTEHAKVSIENGENSSQISNKIGNIDVSLKKCKSKLPNIQDEVDKILDYVIARSELIANITSDLPILFGKGYFKEKENGEERGIIPFFNSHPIKESLCKINLEKLNIQVEKLQNVEVALPYGSEVGTQVIYSILENYVRNVQRYGVCPNKNLEIKFIKIGENAKEVKIKISSDSKIVDDEIFERVKNNGNLDEIFEKYPELRDKYTNLEEIKIDEFFLTKLKKGCIEVIIKRIKDRLEEGIISETGEINPSGWGMKEMKICATLLAGYPISSLLDKNSYKNYFYFNEEDGKDNKYSFTFTMLKFYKVYPPEDASPLKKLEEFIQQRILCDFLKLENISWKEIYNNWESLPLRTLIVGEKDKQGLTKSQRKWIERRFIICKDIQDDNNLEMEFKNKIEKEQSLEYKYIYTRGFTGRSEKEPVILDLGKNKEMYLYHQGYSINESKISVKFSHGEPRILRWIKKLENPSASDRINWGILLGTKMFFIDGRLFNVYKELKENVKRELQNLGIIIFPEKDISIKMEIGEIKAISSDLELKIKDFHFVSVHYGWLEQHPDSPLLKEENIEGFPLYLYMHTGRGKISSEFLTNHWWFKKVLSATNLAQIFSKERKLALSIKIALLEENLLAS